MATTQSRSDHAAAKPPRPISEVGRERETFKYAPFLLNDFRINDTGRLLTSADLATSSDSVMTALAQVGVYQTGTERGFISLFDASHQYFVAEATPLTPLTPSLSNDKCPVRLVHCGTAIPRSHGICEHAISSTLNSGWGRRHIGAVELPITITTELLSDPRFLSKAFCLPRSDTHQYQFYAAVPIRTRAGIDIGTYSVLSPSQPASWDENCAQRLRNVSGAIMEHLVAKRSTHAHRRNERVNRGLGSFIEGKATLSGWRAGSNTAAYTDNIKSDEGMLDTKQQLIERRAEAAMGNDFLVQTPPAVTPVMETTIPADTISHYFGSIPTASVQDKVGKTPQSRESGPLPTPPRLPAAANVAEAEAANTSEESVAQIFSRAANIIRESFEVEGCLFFDVTLGSYRAVSIEHAHSNGGGDHSDNSASPTTSSSEDHFFMSPVVESPDSASDVLAFSTSQASSLNMHDFSGPNEHMTKRLLAKLLRRYPNGMIFNYDASGELQSSDYSEEDGSTDSLPRDKPASSVVSQEATSDGTEGTTPRRTRTNHRFSRVIEAASIYKVFPAARSIVFVPIWDSKRDRWLAGNFIYTLTPTRLFSVEAELSILKAFGKIIAAEVHSLEAQQMDKAKSDTLGSISHELRSPLHGIMLSTELLNDTDMSVFQSNASHTIETCCRTLLDTIDHLLDYSKVNSFGSKHQRSSHSTSHRTQQMQAKAKKSPLGHRAMHTHTRLDSVLEEVTNSMFAGFHFQYSSIKQLSKGKSPWTDTAAHNRLDGAQALEQLGTGAIAGHGQGQATLKLFVRDVSVYVSIDPTFSWMFYSQIGAIRRIVMNLFGNALKYTNQGFIHVSLRQETATAGTGTMRHSKGQRIVTLVVQDTGQGMKEDFLTHKLFRPFTQEDELASGTGLGLSIVKSAVTQLSGRIQVQSKAGVGTVVTVRLPLLLSSEIHNPIGLPDDAAFEHSVQKLKGMRVRIISLGLEQEAGEMASRDIGLDVMQDICRRWLRLDLLGDERAQHVDPDFVLWLDRGVLQSTALSDEQIARYPNVIVCKDPFLAYDGYRTPKSAGEGVFEYITQPIGPRKLAKSMQLAYEQWISLSKLRAPPAPAQRLVPVRSYSPPGSGISGTALSEKARLSAVTATTADVKSGLVAGPGLEGAGEQQRRVPDEEPPILKEEGPVPQENFTPQHDHVVDKILLVDDNHINIKVLGAYMKKLGRTYDVAVNGQEALDAYTRDPSRFAGIIMDISMPVMDGFEATRRIRAMERQHRYLSHDQSQGGRSPVAIVALTGLATDEAQQEAFASGVDIFLTKPVRLNVLQEMLESRFVWKQQGGE